MKKVLLGITAYKYVTAVAFGHHMGILTDGIRSGIIGGLSVEYDMYITMARNKICTAAMKLWEKGTITHLLFLDDDVLIPFRSIEKLIDRNLPVVSGLYFTRDLIPLVYNFTPNFGFVEDVPDSGLLKADGAGAGCLLIECSVLGKMMERKDYNISYGLWFQNSIDIDENEKPKYLGEDVFFFKRLKELGIPVHIDCDVKCEHANTGVANYAAYKMVKENPDAATSKPFNRITKTISEPEVTTIKSQGDTGITL